MRLELDHVGIGEEPGAPLPELSVVADRGLPGFVAVETVDAPVLASLVAGGRMAPTQGHVTLDGRDDAAAIRASVALVDTPSVAEPFGSLTVAQVAREELALAGLRSDRASTALLLDEIGLADHRRTRLQALPTELRVRLLCELAVLRDGVRGLVLTSPERHGGDVVAWLAVVHDLVARGFTVLTVTGFAALAAVEALPVPDFALHGEHVADGGADAEADADAEPGPDPADETARLDAATDPGSPTTASPLAPDIPDTPDHSAVAPTREDPPTVKIVAIVRAELQRLTSTGLARLALVALMTVPLLYGGLYLWANQDPYANLDQVPAALVDEDQGAVVDGTATNYGSEVTDEVVDGGDFDWHTVSAAEAAAGLRDGTYDFTFTIPRDFSADLTSASSDDPRRAQIVLATNDTNSYLSTTIAEQAGKTIRASVAEKVGEEAASTLLVGLADIRTELGSAADGASQLASGADSAVSGADQLVTGSADASSGADQLSAGATTAAAGARSLATGTSQLSTGASTLSTGLDQLRDQTTGLPASTQQLADGAAQVADGTEQLATAVGEAATASQAAADAAPETQAAIGQQLVALFVSQGQTQEEAVASAAEVASYFAPVTDRLAGANTQIQQLDGQVGALATGADQVSTGAAALATATPALTTGIADAADGADTLATGASDAASGAASLSTGLDDLETGAASLSTGLGTLSTGTVSLRDGLVTLDDGAVQLRDGLQSGLAEIPASTEQSRDDQASAISDPVSVDDKPLTSAGTYGAGLAPFFISLAAWIGIYALFLIVKPVSKRAITAVRAPVRVVAAGWLTPALLGVVQMIALFAIVRGVLGFEVVHPWAMVGLMALASVAFAAIIMTLNVLLGSVGQFLGLVLMVVQLVTAGGTFPWQTLPGPLAALHFVLPMSYATDGLRQLMYGGSTGTAWTDAGVLACWLLGALLVSLLATARMTRRRTLRDLRPSLIG